jgi:hypothetical protein
MLQTADAETVATRTGTSRGHVLHVHNLARNGRIGSKPPVFEDDTLSREMELVLRDAEIESGIRCRHCYLREPHLCSRRAE